MFKDFVIWMQFEYTILIYVFKKKLYNQLDLSYRFMIINEGIKEL